MTRHRIIMAVGRLYRGVMISQKDEEQFVILDEAGRRYEFLSQREAELFVEAWLMDARLADLFKGQAVNVCDPIA